MAEPAALSTRIRVGCAGLPPGMRRQALFAKLGFLETTETLASLPRPAVLRRWRREAPDAARFGLVVGDSDPQDVSVVQTASFTVDAIVDAAATLRADVVLFRTSTSLTPSADNRDRLRRFFAEVAHPDRFADSVVAWEPQGLWEPESAAALCAELGVAYVCDPLTADPLAPGSEFYSELPGNQAYFRITGLGRPQQHLDEQQLDRLLALAAGYPRAWVVFATHAKLKDALAFRRRCDAVS